MSARVHLAESVASLPAAIDVIDRFIKGQHRYPLEWDDFISWDNGHPLVEQMRVEIGGFEPQLFAGKDHRADYIREIEAIRDRYAAIIGREPLTQLSIPAASQ